MTLVVLMKLIFPLTNTQQSLARDGIMLFRYRAIRKHIEDAMEAKRQAANAQNSLKSVKTQQKEPDGDEGQPEDMTPVEDQTLETFRETSNPHKSSPTR